MAFKTITARFQGICRRCGGAIEPGDKMRYGGRGQTYHLKADCEDDDDGPEVDEASFADDFPPGAVAQMREAGDYRSGMGREDRELDNPEYESARVRGLYDYRDERGIWHLE